MVPLKKNPKGGGNEQYSKKVSLFMLVLMITLLFSTAQGCTSLPLTCSSQPPPPPVACPPPPPPPVACPPPPYPYVAPPPPYVTCPPPPYPFPTPLPPYSFVAPPPPSQTSKDDSGDSLVNLIKSLTKLMSVIVPVVILFIRLGCCGRSYYRRRERLQYLQDGENALNAI